MERVEAIQLDLAEYRITLQFPDNKAPLVVHFDTPSRRFYFSVIALIITEMKMRGRPEYIHIRRHQKILTQLDLTLSGKNASKNAEGMWAKINMAWRHRLPDLESAAVFKVLDRDLIPPYEKGGRYRYHCSETECDVWASLFGYDENNKWRFKFAFSEALIGLNDISLTLGDLRDKAAWDEFVDRLDIPSTTENDLKESMVAAKAETPSLNGPLQVKAHTVIWSGAAVAAAILIAIVVWRFALHKAPDQTESIDLGIAAYPSNDKPSLAVLPFVNLTGDPQQDYFSDGLTEEIITALSNVPKLIVIARNSTFTYKGKPVKVQQISEELGVRYVLEGSVRKSGDEIRITAQLVDAINGHHLWAQRYDGNLSDIFAVQEEITKKIISALQVKLTEGEEVRIAAKGTSNLQAYLKYLQANELFYKHTPEDCAMARKLAEEAVALDPRYASAYYVQSKTHILDMWFGTSKSPKASMAKAKQLLQKAIDLNDAYADAYAFLGWLFAMTGQYDKALAHGEKAVALNPNSAESHMRYGKILTQAGKYKESISELQTAISLNPIPPNVYLYSLGLSYCFDGQYDQAIKWCERAVREDPNAMFARLFMALTYSLSGRDEEAQIEAAEVLRIYSKFSLEKFAKRCAQKDKTQCERVVSALRKAGLK